ncbi:MAG: site-specific DNA-methyltransferase, partial [Methanobacteriota archaeon]
SHNFHSFPAKFPPQLPALFIHTLTQPGEVVLDPMMGSGTTVLEAYLAGRKSMGFDIDPLAIKIARVKTTPLKHRQIVQHCRRILENARSRVASQRAQLLSIMEQRWDKKTRNFIDYWFAPETQLELLALILEIEAIDDEALRNFFEVVFSAIIITKSGGVSLALDLAHTRPHRAKVVVSREGRVVQGKELFHTGSKRKEMLTKRLRSPVEEFEKRCLINLEGIREMRPASPTFPPELQFGNAQNLPLESCSVDLIVTSPPYASNAIDYMRAHKFSLVWLGYPMEDLSERRREYIGGEKITEFRYEELPGRAARIVQEITRVDAKKGKVLHRYYSEMTRILEEMYRVLKPGKAAIVVVGSSVMRGRDTETARCLAEIGEAIGFRVPKIGVRRLDRNKRMMPAGAKLNRESQIQQRMHEEFVIGFYKPEE